MASAFLAQGRLWFSFRALERETCVDAGFFFVPRKERQTKIERARFRSRKALQARACGRSGRNRRNRAVKTQNRSQRVACDSSPPRYHTPARRCGAHDAKTSPIKKQKPAPSVIQPTGPHSQNDNRFFSHSMNRTNQFSSGGSSLSADATMYPSAPSKVAFTN